MKRSVGRQECCAGMPEKSVKETCCRDAFEKNFVEKCCDCRDVLGKSFVEKCWRRILWRSVVETCCIRDVL